MVLSVQEDGGGDWTALDLAVDDATSGEVINIEGEWDNDDTDETVIAIDCQIYALGASKHPGYWDGVTNKHHRLVGNANHALMLNGAYTAIIDGLCIEQEGTVTSDECFRCTPGTSDSVTATNCIFYCSTDTSQQDCIYTGYSESAGDITLEQCICYGAGRGGLHTQNGRFSFSVTIHVNSCKFWDNGNTTTNGGGLLAWSDSATASVELNIHNTIAVENDTATTAADYMADGSQAAGITWNISNSMDSDGSIAGVLDSGGSNFASRAAHDTDQGTGSYVIFEDITSAPFDLRLQDLGNAKNNAQDAHTTKTAHTLSIPDNDIVGTSRPQNTNYDIGPFEVVAAGGGLGIPIAMHHYTKNIGTS